METFVIRLKSTSPNCRPLVCDCGLLYLNIKPTVSLPIRTGATAPGDNLLLGTIAGISRLGDCDGDGLYEWDYTISYDETQLAEGASLLSACDIESMCCRDCTAIALEKIIARATEEPIL